jgi:hypothetical protein
MSLRNAAASWLFIVFYLSFTLQPSALSSGPNRLLFPSLITLPVIRYSLNRLWIPLRIPSRLRNLNLSTPLFLDRSLHHP